MEDTIKIKCPFDGATLTIKNMPGIESKSVTCPVCKKKFPFTEFRLVSGEGPSSAAADSAGSDDVDTSTALGTDLPGCGAALGQLESPSLPQPLKLCEGRNVVGRQAKSSQATIQLPTGPSRGMSREHLLIEAKSVPGLGYVHYASLCKAEVNATFVNQSQLHYGDCVVLHDGDELRLPDVTLRFVVPDPDATELGPQ